MRPLPPPTLLARQNESGCVMGAAAWRQSYTGTRSAAVAKENPRTYATTGGFQITLPTGLGMGDGGRPADLRGHMAEWPRDCHRTPRRRLLEDSALTAHGKGGRRGQR